MGGCRTIDDKSQIDAIDNKEAVTITHIGNFVGTSFDSDPMTQKVF